MKESETFPIGTLCRVIGDTNQYLTDDIEIEDFVGDLLMADFVIVIEQTRDFIECISKHGIGFVFAGTIEKDQ